jgi:hypothetical protein
MRTRNRPDGERQAMGSMIMGAVVSLDRYSHAAGLASLMSEQE